MGVARDLSGRYRAPLFVARRLVSAIPTLLAVLTVIFFAIRTLPGDPALAILGDNATDAAIAALREKLGLNLPVWWQYFDFLGGLFRGDLGSSLVNLGQRNAEKICRAASVASSEHLGTGAF